MIGVISRKGQEETVGEFFELFKTPWEHYREDATYDVVIATDPGVGIPPAKLVIAYSAEPTALDDMDGVRRSCGEDQPEIEWEGLVIPIYGHLAGFEGPRQPLLSLRGGKPVGFCAGSSTRRVLRIGYDLFDEVGRLLRYGQPEDKAKTPTLELHIAMLRNLILDAGIPVVEIPPSPYGYDFITCLTHDIDFMAIRDHKFDHSMLGFVYRSLIPRYLKGLEPGVACARYLRNLRALLSIPLVHTGLLPDFWYPLDRYIEMEGDLKSTFFFLPFRGRAGASPDGKPAGYRAARYDVRRYKNQIMALKHAGREVGLHGIDSWQDSRKGREEIDVMREIMGDGRIGVRMHWLYFSDDAPRHLDEAGFYYDSTLGYNETVGFRSGTTQVYRLPGTSSVFELPLNIQDTAMFYPRRMGASESQAIDLCGRLIEEMRNHGGVFTVNWHDRSLAPERNWDVAYRTLLDLLRGERTWFATAGEAVGWFEKRRAARFEVVAGTEGVPKVTGLVRDAGHGPSLALRVHACAKPPGGDRQAARGDYVDRPLTLEPGLAVGR